MQIDETKLNTVLDLAVKDLSAAYGGVMVSLGRKLGLYAAMMGAGPLRPAELAARAACAERYVREWLNSQAAGGYVEYDASRGTYELPAEHALVLADDSSAVYMPPAWDIPASMWMDEDKTMEAFRTGRGVAWGDHDHRLFHGVASLYRNAYRENLVESWIPALNGVEEKLRAGGRVADVGCGFGHSTILMAEAFPESTFFGLDVHAGSIEQARWNATEAGVSDRVEFGVADAGSYEEDGFDLICFFDCLHDLGDPVGALRNAGQSLAAEGTVMAVEPFANDRLEENFNPLGRMAFAASTALCVAHSLSEDGGAALGAQAGAERLTEVFHEAGLPRVRQAVTTPFNIILEGRA